MRRFKPNAQVNLWAGKRIEGFFPSVVLQAVKILVLFLGLALIASGCSKSLKELETFKQRSSAGNYEWIAAQPVLCEPGDEGCNQLHLIKGDACFQLAKGSTDAAKHYQCAADELELGIHQTTQWKQGDLNLNRAQNYENRCESLRNLQDLQKGDAGKATGERFLAAAEEFAGVEPNHVGAIYFVSKARLRKLQPELIDVTDANRQNLREQLDQILNAVEGVMSRADGVPQNLWARYKENYALLKKELTLAKKIVG